MTTVGLISQICVSVYSRLCDVVCRLWLVTKPPDDDRRVAAVVLDYFTPLRDMADVEVSRFIPHQHTQGVEYRVDHVVVGIVGHSPEVAAKRTVMMMNRILIHT